METQMCGKIGGRVRLGIRIFGLFLGFAISLSTAFSCTTFVLKGGREVYFGRNLDWSWETGLVIINQRNVQKSSLVPPGVSAVQWTSRFGSVTFNQFGQEMPYGGMNEAGLVIECLWLDETQYAPVDSRPAINLLQWIQYQLDNCRTVEEVMATDAKVRLYAPSGVGRIHYFICDAGGNCATVEMLGGKMVCKRGQDLPFHVLANDTYENSIAYARLHAGTETNADRSSLNRFCAADRRVNDFRPGSENENVQYAFDALDRISQGDFTVWSIVYEISKRRIQYRTRSNHQIRSIDFSALDFSCGGPVLFRDIEDDPAKNNGPEFEVLTKEKQRGYLENLISGASMKQKFGDLRPQVFGQLKMLDDFHCQQNHQEASQQSGGRMEDHSTK